MDFYDVEVKRSSLTKPQFKDKLGVFAKRDFRKGEVVIRWNLRVISKKEFDELKEDEKWQFTHKRNGIIYLYPDPERHVNRSKNPNVFPDFEEQANVSLRDIRKGEELTILDTTKEDS